MTLPNIITITADGLRWDGLGCAGDPDILTPNIDALAAHGIRFTNAISPYPCLPAGGHAFLTGAMPGPFDPGTPAPAPPSVLALPEGLRDAGYRTAAIGALDFSESHEARAFDEVLATGCSGLEDAYGAWLKSRGKAAPEGRGARAAALEVRLFPLGETYHPTTWTGNSAVRHCQSAPEPFFLWVSFPRPRPPFDPPAPWNRMYPAGQLRGAGFTADSNPDRVRDEKKLLAAYYGCISQVDRQIGRLLATLTARGRTRNLMILTAGSGMPVSGARAPGAAAGSLPDALIRVPLIVAGHASQRKGVVEPALVGLGDLAPTLFDMLHLEGAAPAGSRSFYRPLLESGVPHRQAVISAGSRGETSLRTARYKWVAQASPEEDALFDLQADPLEMHNLQGTRQSLALRKMLLGVSQREARADE